mgnify:CR=1 FL=1
MSNPKPTVPAPSEGEVNRSPLRQRWQDEHLDAPARELLRRDAAAFLHQSLSTPCLNGIRRAQGIWIESVLQRLGYRQSCRGATVAWCLLRAVPERLHTILDTVCDMRRKRRARSSLEQATAGREFAESSARR